MELLPIVIVIAGDKPVMPGYFEIKQHILQFWAGTYVMDDQGVSCTYRFFPGNNTDVRQIARQHPGNEISGFVVRGIPGEGEIFAMPGEEYLKIRYPPVIDIGIGFR